MPFKLFYENLYIWMYIQVHLYFQSDNFWDSEVCEMN